MYKKQRPELAEEGYKYLYLPDMLMIFLDFCSETREEEERQAPQLVIELPRSQR